MMKRCLFVYKSTTDLSSSEKLKMQATYINDLNFNGYVKRFKQLIVVLCNF